MWMRCSLGQTWNGSTCSGKVKKFSWDDAIAINSFSYADYNDWRLPTAKELKTLVYCSSGKPSNWNQEVNVEGWGGRCEYNYIKPTIFKEVFPNTPATWFWSSSSDAWYVNFSDGFKGNGDYRNSKFAVRLVRN